MIPIPNSEESAPVLFRRRVASVFNNSSFWSIEWKDDAGGRVERMERTPNLLPQRGFLFFQVRARVRGNARRRKVYHPGKMFWRIGCVYASHTFASGIIARSFRGSYLFCHMFLCIFFILKLHPSIHSTNQHILCTHLHNHRFVSLYQPI